MQQTYDLIVSPRTVMGKAVKRLRAQGVLPAVVYGHQMDSLSLSVPIKPFLKVWKEAGESSLVNLIIDGRETMAVIIQHVDTDPLKGSAIHADFHRVKLDEKMTTEIPLEFTSFAPAVKESNGVLVKSLNHLKVSCLPSELVSAIPVDLRRLKTFEDTILVKDIQLPEGITVLNAADEVVATVQPPMSEEEFKKLEEKPIEAVEGVEVVKKVKEDEKEPEQSLPEKG